MSDHRPLFEQEPTTRFSDRADAYARARPSYPIEAIDAILAGLAPRAGHAEIVAADIGAGTGISARLLADRGVRALAIEPNAPMRAAAAPHPLVTWIGASAERTGLGDASVDLVLCAQAFHWFRADDALREFARILVPGGRLVLLWNDRDPTDAATGEYSRLVREASRDHPAESRLAAADALVASSLFRVEPRRELTHAHRLMGEELIELARSASYVPSSGPRRDALEAGLRRLIDAHGGAVTIRYTTRLWMAHAATPPPYSSPRDSGAPRPSPERSPPA